MNKILTVKVDSIYKVYPHKEKCCYYNAYNLFIQPEPKDGQCIGGFFDELFTLKKGKKYEITVKEIK